MRGQVKDEKFCANAAANRYVSIAGVIMKKFYVLRSSGKLWYAPDDLLWWL
jgi:hypothetical protein